MPHYVKTTNLKYITYCIVVSPDEDQATIKLDAKFGHVDMRADRQTDRHADRNTSHHYWGEVTSGATERHLMNIKLRDEFRIK